MPCIGIDCRMYSSAFTGIGRYVFELVKNILEMDKTNNYVLFFNTPEYEKFNPPSGNVRKVLAQAPHYSFREQTNFLRAINREKLDLMHFTHFNAPVLYRRPSVVTIHDLTLHFYPGKKKTSIAHRLAYSLALKTAVRKAEKVITISLNTKNDLQKILRTPADKIEVIYEGVDEKFKILEDFQPVEIVKNRYGLDKPYLLYTGVWRCHKNLPNLIQAFHILKTEYGFEGYLVITGRRDPLYATEILSKAVSLNVGDDVIFTGLVEEDELVPLYNGALAYVFPSLYEGFGLPPLEAMKCGIPVAASRASCLPEICGEENAVFFDPGSPGDMAEKIFRVTSEKSLRDKLIKNGLLHAQKFSWEEMAANTLALYNSILQR